MKKKSLILRGILYLTSFLVIFLLLVPTFIRYKYVQRKELEAERDRIVKALEFESPEIVLKESKNYEREIGKRMKKKRGGLMDAPSHLRTLALVYELNKDYDRALYWLNIRPEADRYVKDIARIKYKRGNLSEAFKSYCDLPEGFLYEGTAENQIRWGKHTVLMTYGNWSRFSPFASYGDFLTFLDEEQAKADNASDYDKVVNWYHSLDTTLPKEGTSMEEEEAL